MLLNDLKADTPSWPSVGPGARLPLCLERVVSCADLVRSRSGGTQQISVITVARPAYVIGGVPTSKPGEFPVLLVAPLGGEEPTFLRYLGPHSEGSRACWSGPSRPRSAVFCSGRHRGGGEAHSACSSVKGRARLARDAPSRT